MSAAFLSWGVASAAVGCDLQPSAGDLWGRPLESAARSAHATITAVSASTGVALQGDGTVVFKPRMAMSLRLQSRVGPVQQGALQVLEVGGVTYQRVAADQKWARSVTPALDPTWERATDPRLVGQETVRGDRAWHLRATRAGAPVELWVRMSDGFPLEVVTGNGSGTVFTFVYDAFNTGATVVAPPAVEIKPPSRALTGRVGDSLALSAARIAVLDVDDNATPDDDSVRPRPGNRFVVVDVAVQNTSGGELSTFLDWRLTDSVRNSWSQALAIREPSFLGGELEPGETARGFLTYEISSTASQLVLTVRLNDDTASFALS